MESLDNAEVLQRETGQAVEPAKLVAPMLARFMATDRAFAKARHEGAKQTPARGAMRDPAAGGSG